MRLYYHTLSGVTFVGSFYYPKYACEFRAYLQGIGYRGSKLRKMTLQKLRKLYIKERLEREGKKVCQGKSTSSR